MDGTKVLVTDGAAFEGNSDRYLHFALNVSTEVLDHAVARIGHALEAANV